MRHEIKKTDENSTWKKELRFRFWLPAAPSSHGPALPKPDVVYVKHSTLQKLEELEEALQSTDNTLCSYVQLYGFPCPPLFGRFMAQTAVSATHHGHHNKPVICYLALPYLET